MSITPLNPASQLYSPSRPLQSMVNNPQPLSNNIDLSVTQKPMQLMLRSAIEQVNEYLAPELGEDAIGKAAQSGVDFSPDAVAERIVSFATSAYGAYAERHDDQSGQEQLDGFMQLVGDAILKGFDEAKDILQGLKVFTGETADNANRTYDLIQEKLNAFAEQISQGFEQNEAEQANNLT